MKLPLILTLIYSTSLISPPPLVAADALIPGSPIELTGTQGKFDFIKIDSAHRRLLACHSGNGSLDVIDVNSAQLIKSIPTGVAQGVALDEKHARYFVSVSHPPKLVIIDSTKLEMIGEVLLPDPADLVAYHPKSNRVYVCNDQKPELWVIDPTAKKILSTIILPGTGMEDLDFDPKGDYLFQNLKDTSELAKIDLQTEKVIAKWPTSPAEKPHGLAMVSGTNDVLIVGGTGQLSLMNLTTGQVLASSSVSPKIDEIAYDAGLQRVYCASGLGTISVVAVDHRKLITLAPLQSSPGAHSIALDAQTHAIWITFVKDEKAYIQAFTSRP